MSAKVFLYKLKGKEDRDNCVYIDYPRFECGHYFHVPSPCGPCFWGGKFADYKDIKTVLTKEQYEQFLKLCNELSSFGSGLDKDEEKKGQAEVVANAITNFIDKFLCSPKSEKFAEKIQKEEDEYLKEEYGFDDEDIENIYDYYGGEYFDRAIIKQVFDSSYDVAEELIEGYSIDDWIKHYIDYDKLGDDMVSDGDYVELSDGRIVEYNC